MSQAPLAYSKYELLFTPHLIPSLRNLRGQEWQQLVDSVSNLPETHPDALAFSMMMIKLDNCLNCEMDSYRAQRGCAACAAHAVASFKGSDRQLLSRFEQAQSDVLRKLGEIGTAG